MPARLVGPLDALIDPGLDDGDFGGGQRTGRGHAGAGSRLDEPPIQQRPLRVARADHRLAAASQRIRAPIQPEPVHLLLGTVARVAPVAEDGLHIPAEVHRGAGCWAWAANGNDRRPNAVTAATRYQGIAGISTDLDRYGSTGASTEPLVGDNVEYTAKLDHCPSTARLHIGGSDGSMPLALITSAAAGVLSDAMKLRAASGREALADTAAPKVV